MRKLFPDGKQEIYLEWPNLVRVDLVAIDLVRVDLVAIDLVRIDLVKGCRTLLSS